MNLDEEDMLWIKEEFSRVLAMPTYTQSTPINMIEIIDKLDIHIEICAPDRLRVVVRDMASGYSKYKETSMPYRTGGL